MKKDEPTTSKPITSTDRIYDAVRELRSLEQIATRETVAELSGLKLSVVDDRLRTLVDDGKLKRLLRGVYELVEAYPPARPMSKTVVGDGYVKIEIGDQMITLSPAEDRILAMLQAGAACQAVNIHSNNQHLYLATELAAKVEKLQNQVKALQSQNKSGNSPQADWVGGK